MNATFDITREEILNLAAQKLADSIEDCTEIENSAHKLIRQRVEEIVSQSLKARVEDTLKVEMERIMGQEIVPITIWGERAGAPTTLRGELAKRAQEFWNVKVDSNGKESSGYGCEERYKHMMREILKDAFAQSVKQHADIVVAEFKKAILADSVKIVTEHINKLIK